MDTDACLLLRFEAVSEESLQVDHSTPEVPCGQSLLPTPVSSKKLLNLYSCVVLSDRRTSSLRLFSSKKALDFHSDFPFSADDITKP